jgi:hypothetical protein
MHNFLVSFQHNVTDIQGAVYLGLIACAWFTFSLYFCPMTFLDWLSFRLSSLLVNFVFSRFENTPLTARTGSHREERVRTGSGLRGVYYSVMRVTGRDFGARLGDVEARTARGLKGLRKQTPMEWCGDTGGRWVCTLSCGQPVCGGGAPRCGLASYMFAVHPFSGLEVWALISSMGPLANYLRFRRGPCDQICGQNLVTV